MKNFQISIFDFRLKQRRRGFSFTEVMFAVILLGLGFIMVAAIFPVAIRQSQANMEDTAGVSIGKAAAAVVTQQGLFVDPATPPLDLPATQAAPGAPVLVNRFDATVLVAFNKMAGNLINQADPRYAWVPVAYRRPVNAAGMPAKHAEIFVLAVQARNRPIYDGNDVAGFTFITKQVSFYLTEMDTAGADLLTFTDNPGTLNHTADVAAAGEGTYVLVGNDQLPAGAPGAGIPNGRFYRLGAKRTDLGPGVWELAPGSEMTVTRTPGPDGIVGNADDTEQCENIPARALSPTPPTSGAPAIGFIVGRGYVNPTVAPPPPPAPIPDSMLDGGVQDLFMMPPVSVTIAP
jgi:type II secretory pathway pseudopilin PulG